MEASSVRAAPESRTGARHAYKGVPTPSRKCAAPKAGASLRNSDPVFAVVVPNQLREATLSILWIILIIVVVLALLGFFSRGVW